LFLFFTLGGGRLSGEFEKLKINQVLFIEVKLNIILLGRLGLSVSARRLCDINAQIFGQLILVNIDADHNWGSAHAGDECRVSMDKEVKKVNGLKSLRA